jgi:hypothetical protein
MLAALLMGRDMAASRVATLAGHVTFEGRPVHPGETASEIRKISAEDVHSCGVVFPPFPRTVVTLGPVSLRHQ